MKYVDISILVSGLIFSYMHFMNRWADVTFDKKCYQSLFLLGVIEGMAFVSTKSLLLVIMMHLLYNSISIAVIIKKMLIKADIVEFNDY
jgi:membrane protease YdiL (CAAX protease family)